MEKRVVLHGEKRYDGVIEFASVNGVGNIFRKIPNKSERAIWLKSNLGEYLVCMGIHEKVDIDATLFYDKFDDGQVRVVGMTLLNARKGVSMFRPFAKRIQAHIFSYPNQMSFGCA